MSSAVWAGIYAITEFDDSGTRLWPEGMAILHNMVEKAQEVHRTLDQVIREHREAGADVDKACELLGEILSDISSQENMLRDKLCMQPLAAIAGASRVPSEQEYLSLRMMGVLPGTAKVLGLTNVDDHEAFGHLFYEDDKHYCLINPWEDPQPHELPGASMEGPYRVRSRVGKPPELCSLDSLRPEQKEFFRRHLPTVLARFKKD